MYVYIAAVIKKTGFNKIVSWLKYCTWLEIIFLIIIIIKACWQHAFLRLSLAIRTYRPLQLLGPLDKRYSKRWMSTSAGMQVIDCRYVASLQFHIITIYITYKVKYPVGRLHQIVWGALLSMAPSVRTELTNIKFYRLNKTGLSMCSSPLENDAYESSLLHQQCPAHLASLSWMVCEMRDKKC